jgi:hypothetical protein
MGRLEVLDALLARGFPVDYSPVWYNLLHIAVEQRNIPWWSSCSRTARIQISSGTRMQ